jgi:hypothetical protein
MRFSALLRKELRECLPWMLLAAIAFFVLCGIFLRSEAYFGDRYWRYSRFSPGTTISPYDLTCYPTLQTAGPWLLFSSIGLGLILGVRHFWIPHFTRTWPFLLHRSVSRKTILAAKLTAALIACVVSMGLVWIALFWYASRPEVFAVPQTLRVFVEGWIFIMLGLVVYLGTALSALSTANWYTTKIFGLLFATVIIFMTTTVFSTVWAIGLIAVGTIILLGQIFDTFLRREF